MHWKRESTTVWIFSRVKLFVWFAIQEFKVNTSPYFRSWFVWWHCQHAFWC